MSIKTNKDRQYTTIASQNRLHSRDSTTGCIIRDKIIDFDGMQSQVRDAVLLSLRTYGDMVTGNHHTEIGTEKDPVLISVNVTFRSESFEAKYLYRKTIWHYAVDFIPCYKIAYEIVRTYLRAFLLCYPKQEEMLTDREVLLSLFHWTMLVMEDSWVAELKHALLVCFCRSYNQEEPEYKSCHTPYILRGKLGKHAWQKALSKRGLKGLVWLNTILHGIKKGMPSVSNTFVHNALIKHSKQMIEDEEADEAFLHMVEDISKIVFKDVCIKDPTVLHKLSQNASYENSRANCGALQLINGLENFRNPELIYMFDTPKGGVQSVYTNKFNTDLVDYRKIDNIGKSRWKVEVIREPLKVRTITKGETHLNAVWSDIQKQLLESIQRFRPFRLTKGQKLEKDLQASDLLFRDCFTLGDWNFVSGDYAGATDTIKREVMISATAGIRDPILRSLLISNLSDGIIEYRDLCKRLKIPVIEDVHQVRGQLMGSIFSFPILCLINMCTYTWACQETEKANSKLASTEVETPLPSSWFFKGYEDKLHDLPVLINGDDILFISPSEEFYDHWEDGLKHAGFRKSVGKNYVTKEFLLVNSRLCLPFDPVDYSYEQTSFKNAAPECREVHGNVLYIRAIPYINMGLINGRKKGDDSTDEPKTYREKMAKLPGYFRDLWKDFGGFFPYKGAYDTISSLRRRIVEHVWNVRTDLRRSGWGKDIVGLTPLYGSTSISSFYEHYRDVQILSSSKASDWDFRSSIERSLYWFPRTEIDTSVLYPLKRKKEHGLKDYDEQLHKRSKSLLGEFMKKDLARLEQDEIDKYWSVHVTPTLNRIPLVGGPQTLAPSKVIAVSNDNSKKRAACLSEGAEENSDEQSPAEREILDYLLTQVFSFSIKEAIEFQAKLGILVN